MRLNKSNEQPYDVLNFWAFLPLVSPCLYSVSLSLHPCTEKSTLSIGKFVRGNMSQKSQTQPDSRKSVRFDCDQAETDSRSSSSGSVATSGTKPTAPGGIAVEPSLQIVPYIPRDAQSREHPLFTLLSKERRTPQMSQASGARKGWPPSPPSSPPPPPSSSPPPGQLGGVVEQLQLGPVLPRVRCPSNHFARNHQAKEVHAAILDEFVFRSPVRSPPEVTRQP